MAEGRGKIQAQSLRKARREIMAKKLSVSAPTLQKEMHNLNQSLHMFHEGATISYGENDRVHLTLPVEFDLREFLYRYLSEAIDFQILSYVFFHREESTTKMNFCLDS